MPDVGTWLIGVDANLVDDVVAMPGLAAGEADSTLCSGCLSLVFLSLAFLAIAG